jgi:hypothetical protein
MKSNTDDYKEGVNPYLSPDTPLGIRVGIKLRSGTYMEGYLFKFEPERIVIERTLTSVDRKHIVVEKLRTAFLTLDIEFVDTFIEGDEVSLKLVEVEKPNNNN